MLRCEYSVHLVYPCIEYYKCIHLLAFIRIGYHGLFIKCFCACPDYGLIHTIATTFTLADYHNCVYSMYMYVCMYV